MHRLVAIVVCAWALSGCRGRGPVDSSEHDPKDRPEPTGGTGIDTTGIDSTGTESTGSTGTLTETGPLPERQMVHLSTAAEDHQGGNASLMLAHGGVWVLWENATLDQTVSLLRLIHSVDDPLTGPLDGPWTETEVRRTAGSIKPSLAASPDGAFVVSNECGGACDSVGFNQGRLTFHPASEPAASAATWVLPNHPDFDTGRGDVAVGPDGPVVCYSTQDRDRDLEWIRCDTLRGDTWESEAELRRGHTADHPSTLLDHDDQLVVGFDGRADNQREAHIRFADGVFLRLSPGYAGGDVQLALHGNRLHAAWHSRFERIDTAHHGVCETYPDCQTLDRWTVTDLGHGVGMEGVGIAADDRNVVVVWSQEGEDERPDVHLWWGEGASERLVVGASTNQGQPNLVLDDEAAWLVFTEEPVDAPMELYLAWLPRP